MEFYQQLESLAVPIVELLGDGHHQSCDVLTDSVILGNMATLHFHQRGFRNYAYFSTEQTWWSQQFFESYQNTINGLGYSAGLYGTRQNASL